MADVLMEKIISLAKRRGFIFQGSEIYGGLAGTWDYGPMGVALKNNIKNVWWKTWVDSRSDVHGVDAAIIMHPRVWKTSGHVTGFNDPLVECKNCHSRFRADQIGWTNSESPLSGIVCPECAKEDWTDVKNFNMMFKSSIGTVEDSASAIYLRPETAGGIFTNYKQVLDAMHPAIPFGIAQIGKAFRNEIAPRDFIFRVREFEQMELEWFTHENEWEKWFEHWRENMWNFIDTVGIDRDKTHELEVPKEDLAHYSKRTIDFEFDYPFGRKELYGLAYRTDFDLKGHMEASGVDLQYFDQESGERFIPHVVEPSLGLDRTVLAVLLSAYGEDDAGGETRIVLRLKPTVAPVQVAVLPLMKKGGLAEKAQETAKALSTHMIARYDESGSIGKRYRRQDEIGTPWCVTVDFDTLEDGTVTVRDRDTMKQERIAVDELPTYFSQKLTLGA